MKNHLLRYVFAHIDKRTFHASASSLIYEIRRSGYKVVYDREINTNLSFVEKLQLGYRQLWAQSKVLWNDIVDGYYSVEKTIIPHHVYPQWKFEGGEKSRAQWVVTSDSDYNEGFSTAKLEITPYATGLFYGTLNPSPPKDGVVQRAGYCNITTIPRMKAFWRIFPYDWTEYNVLVLRVRGDGRNYTINLLCDDKLDVTWNDIYHYVLYTRGGPYWQDVEIPFSKFLFSSKGQVMDNQIPVTKHNIRKFGITLMDKVHGPFKLELSYIGVKYDPGITEETAYEKYDYSKTIW